MEYFSEYLNSNDGRKTVNNIEFGRGNALFLNSAKDEAARQALVNLRGH